MNSEPTVLIADDEEPMRQFMVNLLRYEKCQVIAVATNGKEALALYHQYQPDITLLDIKMPEMSGMDVLEKIRESDKSSFVSMVSADAFPETIRHAAGLGVSGYLVKPIDHKKIQALLKNFERIQSITDQPAPISHTQKKSFYPTDEELAVAQKLVDSINFPSIPEAVTALQQELMKEEPDFDRVAEVISSDIKLSGLLLRLVNSAAFGLKQKVNSIQQAVVVVGLASLKGVLLASALRSSFEDESEFDQQFWGRANVTAISSETIAHAVIGVSPEDAFLAGLFHDAGALICQRKHERYGEIYRYLHSIPVSVLDFERKIFKTTHMAISYVLARQWKLPEQICDAILLSHNLDYSSFNESEVSDLRALVSILKVSDYVVAKRMHPAMQIKAEGEMVYRAALEELMIDEDVLLDAMQATEQAILEVV